MARACHIDSIQSIATLPESPAKQHGLIQTNAVYSIADGSKRRRLEVVASVDGDCVNIYNVRSSRLVVSHAVAPQAILTCSPVSIYTKQMHATSLRHTYIVTRNRSSHSKLKITCFVQDKSDPVTHKQGPTTLSKELGTSGNDVLFLEALPTLDRSESHEFDILVVHKNGLGTCFTSDLQLERWSMLLEPPPASQKKLRDGWLSSIGDIEYCRVISLKQALRGVLKGRNDVIATLPTTHAANNDAKYILCAVTKAQDTDSQTPIYKFSLYLHPANTSISDVKKPHSVVPVAHWGLPGFTGTDVRGSSMSSFHFDSSEGLLHGRSGNSFLCYDLNDESAKFSYQLQDLVPNPASYISLSTNSCMITTNSGCSVFNTTYQSRLAHFAFQESPQATTGQKRRRSIGASFNPLDLKHHFPGINLVVGISANQLVGVQLSYSKRATKQKYANGRLIDSLGKGAGSSRSGIQLKREYLDKLSELTLAENTSAFDDVFFSFVNDSTPMVSTDSEHIQSNVHEYGNLDVKLRSTVETIQKSDFMLEAQRNRALARAVLALIFNVRPKSVPRSKPRGSYDTRLNISFYPSKTVEWLITRGFVTAYELRSAISQYGQEGEDGSSITAIDLVNAIANHDPSLNLLWKLITSGAHLDLPGTIQMLKVFIKSFETQRPTDSRELLTDGSEDIEQQLKIEQEAAVEELRFAITSLRQGLSIRSVALRTCLAQIPISFPPPQIVQALREQLSSRELAILIDLLRIELAEGGWTTRYVDADPHEKATMSTAKDEAIAVICCLLNCTLDAMGISGWLSGVGSGNDNVQDDDHAETLISFLRAETSATLEGIQESSFFCGFLRDFFRYEQINRAAQTSIPNNYTSRVQSSINNNAGAIVLPLGVRDAKGVSRTRHAAGNEVQRRSKRDIGYQKNKRLGMYTFEQIRI